MASGDGTVVPWQRFGETASPLQEFVFTHAVGPADAEGAWSLTASASDPAGNASGVLPLGSLVVDRTAPSVAAVEVDPALARPGEVVQVKVTLSEESAAPPRLTGADGSATVAFDLVRSFGELLVFRSSGQSVDDGRFPLVLSGVADAAGNALADASVGTLAVDGTPPALAFYEQSGSRFNGSQALVVRLTPSEPLRAPPAVRLGGHALTHDASAGESPYRFTLSFAGTGLQGTQVVEVDLVDLAGNALSLQAGTVEVDAVAPEVLDVVFSPPVARLGLTAFATVTTSEPLVAAPTLAWSATGGDPGFAYEVYSGLAYTYKLPVTAATKPGTYRLESVHLEDQAGNAVDRDLAGLGFLVDFTVDNQAPVVTGLKADAARYSRVPGHDLVTLTMKVSDFVSLDVRVGDQSATCSPVPPDGQRCLYTVRAADVEGVALVTVTAGDAAGNIGFASGFLVFDFTPPQVVLASIAAVLSPPPGCPLHEVDALGLAGTAQVQFSADEPLGAEPAVQAADLSFVLAGDLSGAYAYTATVASALAAQGGRQVTATLVDLVGNAATAPVVGLVVDTAAPAAPDTTTAGKVVYERTPWGAEASAGAKRFRVVGGSGAVEAGAVVRVLEDSGAASTAELGRTVAGANGAFSADLLKVDHSAVYVVALDAACNASAVRDVKDVLWTASLGGKVPGRTFENPHAWDLTSSFTGQHAQPAAREPASYDALKAQGGASLTQAGAGEWRRHPGPAPVSLPWRNYATAYDERRDRVVLFGGNDLMANPRTDTWEWDGAVWQQRLPADPEGDGNPTLGYSSAMAYDARRARTVLFGGCKPTSSAQLEGLWEWDGASWAKRVPADPEGDGDPPLRFMAQAAYDVARAKVVVFGGSSGPMAYLGDTWEWDGTSWKKFAGADPESDGNPAADPMFALGYDPLRKRTVLWQSASTWEWDGASWKKSSGADPEGDGDPTTASDYTMAWDGGAGRLVMMGYPVGGLQVWEWTGTSWKRRVATDPEGDGSPTGYEEATLWDSSRQRLLHVGALDYATSSLPFWTWTGTSWALLPVATGPSARYGHAMAYDSARKAVVLFGGGAAWGGTDETWLWDGTRWARRTPVTSPAARRHHSMSYDSLRGRVVLFGGETGSGYSEETWEWDGTTWERRATVLTGGRASVLAAMAFDSKRGKTVMVGNIGEDDDDDYVTGTFEWDGAVWTHFAAAPTPDMGAVMAFDPAAGESVLLLGGASWAWAGTSWQARLGGVPSWVDASMALDPGRGKPVFFFGRSRGYPPVPSAALWERGATWQERLVADEAGDGDPVPRSHAPGAFDARGRMVVFGGRDAASNALADTWTWDGGAAQRPGQIARFSFGAAGAEAGSQLQAVVATCDAGGSGELAGASAPGASLKVWRGNDWWERGVNAAPEASPTRLTWTTTDALQLFGLLRGPAQEIALAVTPVGANGKGIAQVAVDYAEVSVRYRRP